jgi:uncharacterized protein YcbK (DUF882 family)
MPGRRFSPSFGVDELACKDGNPVPKALYDNATKVCERAQKLRDLVGPLKVMSGYRTPAHNKKVGGAKGSWHVKAGALDLKSYEKSAAELAAIYEELIKTGSVPDGGLGVYSSWIHIDIGPARRWRG